MDKKCEVSTLIKRNHDKFGDNAYVMGRISGMQLVICECDDKFPITEIEEGHILTTKCTLKQYEDFMNLIEKHYPGLCEFDYKLKKRV